MDHADQVALIRAGVEGSGPHWLELGAGRGAFTLALAELLGTGAQIDAVDRGAGDVRALTSHMAARFPDTRLRTIVADFDRPMDLDRGSYDGLLAANSLHFVRDPGAVLARVSPFLTPGARIVVVEYDSDGGNPWIPHPFSFRSWARIAAAAGLRETRLIGRVPSRFLGAIYAAASELPAAATNPD